MATLTFVYAESTAVIGPLASSDEPHSWDLCDDHARRITVPRGWEMLRSERGFSAPLAEDYELTALAEAVREVGGGRARVHGEFAPHADRDFDERGFDERGFGERGFDDYGPDDALGGGRHRQVPGPAQTPGVAPRRPSASTPADDALRSGLTRPRPGRRGHLRVLPDPVD